ncbi:hypothetical protein M5K25_002865 [Dendrobium thyrsiflorum]|uniref:Uncharacterized protein n=1 Tax=Dendrobium thyrsiflorum TaxID=117978 RepID=A0ABD0VPD1_DENTH
MAPNRSLRRSMPFAVNKSTIIAGLKFELSNLKIVRALEGDASLEDLNEGMRPGQSMLFSSGSDYDSDLYAPNMRRIRRIELTSPEYSGDYSGPIAEYEQSSGEQPFSDDLNTLGNTHRFPAF